MTRFAVSHSGQTCCQKLGLQKGPRLLGSSLSLSLSIYIYIYMYMYIYREREIDICVSYIYIYIYTCMLYICALFIHLFMV